MLYTKRKQLAILDLEKGKESISIETFKEILTEKPSNMIYCESEGKLVGLVSTGDICRALRANKNEVVINKKFTYLNYGEYAKAKAIFKERARINALPVVTKDHILIGDYTRWNDLLVLRYLIGSDNGQCVPEWVDKENIMLVRPGNAFEERQMFFNIMEKYLKSRGAAVKCIGHAEIEQYLKENAVILFVEENELRACNTVQRITFKHDNKYHNLKTYKSVFSSNFCFSDEKYISYLNKLQQEGVEILGLEFEESEYYECLSKKIKDKFAKIGEVPNDKWPQKIYEDFFDDLYNEDYAEHISHITLSLENHGGVFSLKDYKDKYCNVINGERRTVNQPDKYAKSIYFFGPCYIQGFWVEDRNTIESFLQEHICCNGMEVRVVNCGTIRPDSIERMYLPRIAVTQLKRGDIIVVDCPPKGVEGVRYLDLNHVLEKNNVGTEWMLEKVCHCNHRINQLYADEIYNLLAPVLQKETERQGELIDKDEDFVKFLYLDRYFKAFDPSGYKKIGSVVMNCNPFTYGHRYLIEQALQAVDFLIIFVVEQDKSFFSFAERFAMVQKGVEDLEHVMVVPSGQFIASQMTIPEYFGKQLSENAAEHDEQDFEVFAKQIARPLGISIRYFGEEPLDAVTNQYNISAKKVLPKYGIEAVVIPRKTIHGKEISASKVRKCLDEMEDFDQMKEWLPETTKELLGIG